MEPQALKDLINAQRAELTNRYFPQDKSLISKILPGDLYQETQQLAYHSISFGVQYIIKISTITSSINLFFILGVQLLMFFCADRESRRSTLFIVVETVFSIGVILCVARLFNKKPQVIIDKTGIDIINSGEKIEWQNIAMTYIRVTTMEKTVKDYLVINYYAPWNNDFEEKEIDITDLDTSRADISSAIEHYKKQP